MDTDDISTLRPGTVLHAGTYRIIKFLSKGGFGCTYLAEHLLLEERVAVKELFLSEWCNRDDSGSISVAVTSKVRMVERLHKKFIDEAKAQRRMNHPGVIKVSDVFEENGTAYYVMDYIDGESLKDRMQRLGHGMPEAEALGYIRQVCDALAYVHSLNRLHLDIKPGNIMIDRDGHAILIDFGVSKQYEAESGENHSTLLGVTPGYSSPEQKSGEMKHFSPASDIYSLGATLYNLLTGKVVPTTDLRISGEPLPPLPANISPTTRETIEAALQLEKDRRPQSISEFLEILDGGAPAETELVEETTPAHPKESDTTLIPDKPNPPQPPRKDPPKSSDTEMPESRQQRKFLWILLAVFFVVVIVVAKDLMKSGQGDDNIGIEKTPVEPVPEPVPDPEPLDTLTDIVSQSESALETHINKGITFNVKGVKFDMVRVEGGTFDMGSYDSEAYDWEKPVHSETVSDFYIGSTEVTQDLWEAVMGSNPSEFRGGNLPVENVSWNDCQTFCNRLSDITCRQFRLPTEAEWEYAARGGNHSSGYKYSGSNDIGSVAWYYGNSNSKTHPVASKQSNELGLYDMSGNVWEWTSDLWSSDYSSSRNGGYSGSHRVGRGGSWDDYACRCCSASRYEGSPGNRYFYLGLRLAF